MGHPAVAAVISGRVRGMSRALVAGAGLTQPAALALFNRAIEVRPLSESTWKGYFCSPGTTRFRGFAPELLAHAEKVFGPLQK